MDEFGVLTERYGLKPQGKSAPMAESKRPTNASNGQTLNPKSSSYSSRPPRHSSSVVGSFLGDHSEFFQSASSKKTHNFGGLNFGGLDDSNDLFGGLNKPAKQTNYGGSFDYDLIFSGSNNSGSMSSSAYVDDIFGGMPGLKSPASVKNDDGFPSFASPHKQSVHIDDLLDKMGAFQSKSKSPNENGSGGVAKTAADFDDLIPGFRGSSSTDNGVTRPHKSALRSNKITTTSYGDPFSIFETTTTPSVNSSAKSSIDELENFAVFQQQNNARKKSDVHIGQNVQTSVTNTNRRKETADSARENQSKGVDNLESFFSFDASRSSSAPKSRTTTLDHVSGGQKHNRGKPEVPQKKPSGPSTGINKSSVKMSFDDLSLIFGEATISGEFQEVHGEPEERRRARLGRHQRTNERLAKAVDDMNQRELQIKQEQEERRRIAGTVDVEINRWAAGKEGNMRALLSTLQYVLWPECGWQPVSLTDVITSASVKKVYRKATLCVHPDKVQQKGANLEQKYTAEKVFDILKEAWNKFTAEELS
ncbi:Auxilin-related protein 1 [Quillaja saponaria]|uniref:Auxilin-related protein 1 n=1 Tax=Quillaja saponaria TaxID=32244 RepID=A0AAD7LWC3_QUISA|nr:Auxilin-related protein 1 [Quillaja saponaria]